MTKPGNEHDPELEAIIKHANAQAEELYPKRELSLRARIALIIAGFLIVSNSVIGLVNTSILSQQKACLKEQNAQVAVVRTANSKTTQVWINALTDDLDAAFTGKAKLTQAQFDTIRNTYNQAITDGNNKIAALQAESCN